MFSRVRGFLSCQNYSHTATPAITLPSSGSANFAGVEYPLLPLDQHPPYFFNGLNETQAGLGKTRSQLLILNKTPISIILSTPL